MQQATGDSSGPGGWLTTTASDGALFVFASREEAIAYLSDQADKWDWIRPHIRNAAGSPVLKELQQVVAALCNAPSEIPKQPEGEQQDIQIKAAIEEYLSFKPALHDRNALQAQILQIGRRNPLEATWALAWTKLLKSKNQNISAHQLPMQEPYFFAGMIDAWLLNKSKVVSTDGENELITLRQLVVEGHELKDEIAVQLRNIEAVKIAVAAIQEEANVSLQFAKERVNGASAHLLTETTAAVKSAEEKLDAKWKAIAATYDNQLALRAPSKYWAAKQNRHQNISKWFGAALVLSALVGAFILWKLDTQVFGDLKANQIPTWGQILSATVSAVIFLWILKTLIRLTLSHIHLALDAEERRTMILSYLAMSRLSDVTTEDRKILLTSIFRPSGDGIVKDEAPPVPIFELFKGGK